MAVQRQQGSMGGSIISLPLWDYRLMCRIADRFPGIGGTLLCVAGARLLNGAQCCCLLDLSHDFVDVRRAGRVDHDDGGVGH